MANGFSKEERVAFEDLLEGFNDSLVLSRNVSMYRTDQTMMERTNDVIWRPMPYIAQSFDGTDQTANFSDNTQLSVPATIGFNKSVPWIMTATELRDALQENRLGDAAKQKLASDVNVAVMNVAALQGTLVVKLDYANRLAAAAGGGSLTVDTQAAATNYWVPKATSVAATGETSNVDNRYQTITISSTTNVAAGDCFTIAGVNAVHHITKGDTGQLKTFRVISVDSGTTMTISPPIISNQGGSDAEAQYQNVTVTESATAAIVFLNTAAAYANPFWQKDAIEILPGRYAVPTDAGVAVMRATTEQGIEVVMQKFYDINTMKTKYRLDTLFGVVNKQPEMSGIMLFSQS